MCMKKIHTFYFPQLLQKKAMVNESISTRYLLFRNPLLRLCYKAQDL